MRRLFIFAFLFLVSCGYSQQERIESGKDEDSTLKAINRNLELVNQRQGIIPVTSRDPETLISIADNRRIQNRIEGNILLIDSVMNDNRSRLKSLERMLGLDRRRIGELETEINGLQYSIDSKQREIDSLKRALVHSDNLAASLHDSLRTCYVLVAPQDSLAKWRVIEKSGGLFGVLGTSWRLSGHIPLKRFSRVNMVRTNRIAVPAKAGNFTIMTLHNRRAFTIAKNRTNRTASSRRDLDSSVITISNPGAFWSASHILVIKLAN